MQVWYDSKRQGIIRNCCDALARATFVVHVFHDSDWATVCGELCSVVELNPYVDIVVVVPSKVDGHISHTLNSLFSLPWSKPIDLILLVDFSDPDDALPMWVLNQDLLQTHLLSRDDSGQISAQKMLEAECAAFTRCWRAAAAAPTTTDLTAVLKFAVMLDVTKGEQALFNGRIPDNSAKNLSTARTSLSTAVYDRVLQNKGEIVQVKGNRLSGSTFAIHQAIFDLALHRRNEVVVLFDVCPNNDKESQELHSVLSRIPKDCWLLVHYTSSWPLPRHCPSNVTFVVDCNSYTSIAAERQVHLQHLQLADIENLIVWYSAAAPQKNWAALSAWMKGATSVSLSIRFSVWWFPLTAAIGFSNVDELAAKVADQLKLVADAVVNVVLLVSGLGFRGVPFASWSLPPSAVLKAVTSVSRREVGIVPFIASRCLARRYPHGFPAKDARCLLYVTPPLSADVVQCVLLGDGVSGNGGLFPSMKIPPFAHYVGMESAVDVIYSAAESLPQVADRLRFIGARCLFFQAIKEFRIGAFRRAEEICDRLLEKTWSAVVPNTCCKHIQVWLSATEILRAAAMEAQGKDGATGLTAACDSAVHALGQYEKKGLVRNADFDLKFIEDWCTFLDECHSWYFRRSTELGRAATEVHPQPPFAKKEESALEEFFCCHGTPAALTRI